jgi:hypothetical protein
MAVGEAAGKKAQKAKKSKSKLDLVKTLVACMESLLSMQD